MRMSRRNIKYIETVIPPHTQSLWAPRWEAAGMIPGLTDRSKAQVDEQSECERGRYLLQLQTPAITP